MSTDLMAMILQRANAVNKADAEIFDDWGIGEDEEEEEEDNGKSSS